MFAEHRQCCADCPRVLGPGLCGHTSMELDAHSFSSALTSLTAHPSSASHNSLTILSRVCMFADSFSPCRPGPCCGTCCSGRDADGEQILSVNLVDKQHVVVGFEGTHPESGSCTCFSATVMRDVWIWLRRAGDANSVIRWIFHRNPQHKSRWTRLHGQSTFSHKARQTHEYSSPRCVTLPMQHDYCKGQERYPGFRGHSHSGVNFCPMRCKLLASSNRSRSEVKEIPNDQFVFHKQARVVCAPGRNFTQIASTKKNIFHITDNLHSFDSALSDLLSRRGFLWEHLHPAEIEKDLQRVVFVTEVNVGCVTRRPRCARGDSDVALSPQARPEETGAHHPGLYPGRPQHHHCHQGAAVQLTWLSHGAGDADNRCRGQFVSFQEPGSSEMRATHVIKSALEKMPFLAWCLHLCRVFCTCTWRGSSWTFWPSAGASDSWSISATWWPASELLLFSWYASQAMPNGMKIYPHQHLFGVVSCHRTGTFSIARADQQTKGDPGSDRCHGEPPRDPDPDAAGDRWEDHWLGTTVSSGEASSICRAFLALVGSKTSLALSVAFWWWKQHQKSHGPHCLMRNCETNSELEKLRSVCWSVDTSTESGFSRLVWMARPAFIRGVDSSQISLRSRCFYGRHSVELDTWHDCPVCLISIEVT